MPGHRSRRRWSETDADTARDLFAAAAESVNAGAIDKGLAGFAEIAHRFEGHPDAAVRAWVANAQVTRAVVIGQTGSLEQSATELARLADKYRGDPSPQVRCHAASAMFNDGLALAHLGRVDEAIARFDETVRLFGADPDPLVAGEVAGAMANKVKLLGQSSRFGEAVAAADELVARFGDPGRDPGVREHVAEALATKAAVLYADSGAAAATGVLGDLAARYSRDADAAVRDWVATAWDQQAQFLSQSGDVDAALAAFSEVERLFEKDGELRAQAARAGYNKGIALRDAGRLTEAAETLDAVAARYDGTDDFALRRVVACSLFNKGVVLRHAGDEAGAAAVFAAVISQFADDPDELIQDWVDRSRASLPSERSADFDSTWARVSGKLDEPPRG
jgi:tetratricopeptide (TPR) repeat protein